jgi:hypothetical protein
MKAKDDAIAEGLEEESEEVKIRMEDARKSVLDNKQCLKSWFHL